MEYAVIFDLDGCISDDRRRLKFLPTGKSEISEHDYDEYHESLDMDPFMNSDVVNYWIHSSFEPRFIFVTARPEKYRARTRAWLIMQIDIKDFDLYMRPANDIRSSPLFKVQTLSGLSQYYDILAAYDDRDDVVQAYCLSHFRGRKLDSDGMGKIPIHEDVEPIPDLVDENPYDGLKTDATEEETIGKTVPKILRGMAETFEARNKIYGDNFLVVCDLVKVLFPEGIPKDILHSPEWHLFRMKLTKLTRFVASGLTHTDSIHDDAVYSAIIESVLLKKETGEKA